MRTLSEVVRIYTCTYTVECIELSSVGLALVRPNNTDINIHSYIPLPSVLRGVNLGLYFDVEGTGASEGACLSSTQMRGGPRSVSSSRSDNLCDKIIIKKDYPFTPCSMCIASS